MDRVQKIKRKYGETAFERWGKSGGSPILKAWSEGKPLPPRRRKLIKHRH